jgi:DNA-binding XRE family transcriptional regulator
MPRKRLHMLESQGCVAQILKVTTDTITNRELNRHEPQIHFYPKIIEYLGYCPMFDLAGTSQAKIYKQYMFLNGLTQKEYAKELGIDPQTLKRRLKQLNREKSHGKWE